MRFFFYFISNTISPSFIFPSLVISDCFSLSARFADFIDQSIKASGRHIIIRQPARGRITSLFIIRQKINVCRRLMPLCFSSSVNLAISFQQKFAFFSSNLRISRERLRALIWIIGSRQTLFHRQRAELLKRASPSFSRVWVKRFKNERLS